MVRITNRLEYERQKLPSKREAENRSESFTEKELRELMGVDRQIYYRKRGAIRSKKN